MKYKVTFFIMTVILISHFFFVILCTQTCLQLYNLRAKKTFRNGLIFQTYRLFTICSFTIYGQHVLLNKLTDGQHVHRGRLPI